MSNISHYFSLQFKLVNRHLSEFGLVPWLGYLLSGVLFTGLSLFLYYKTEYAPYLLLLGALGAALNMGDRSRNDFLKSIFKIKKYRTIRLLENSAIALPFLIILLIKGDYWIAFATIAGAIAMAFIQIGRSSNFTLPTPFGRWPFEFTAGFRKTFYLHLFAYFLTIMGIWVNNFNLGIFSILVVFVVCLTYYGELEADYYIWVHSQKSKSFLWHKIKTALLYSSLLSLPITGVLCGFYPQFFHIILAVQLLGYSYLSCFILAKYAAFPHPISLPQSILFAVCFAMPPLLLLVIPYFYRQSTQKLTCILP
ncbi:MAG: ABC transporter permease [Saprospiraceae bacterium]|nr:ABC transporter permease [Saprospiraceae bacterium]